MIDTILSLLGLQRIPPPTKHDLWLIEHAKQRKEMRKLREEGLTLHAIGKKYGVTKQRVHQIVNSDE